MSAAQIDMATPATGSAVPAVAKRPVGTSDRAGDRALTAKIVGMALVAVVPAIFWTACIWLACRLAGVAIASTSLALIAASIALFMTVIGSALLASR
jgi:hypothetical protein